MGSDPNTAPSRISLCVPALAGREWEYVKECLDTNWVSSVGPFVTRFERELADRMGRRFGVAAVNGTAALHVALLVAGVGPDDEVVMPALTFIAPANAVRYAGAWPVFVDVEPDYWQIDLGKLTDFITRGCDWIDGTLRNRVTGRRVKAILPVDLLGHPVDMAPVVDLARSRDLVVVEDATESLGAEYRGEPVGRLSDVACLSFNGNKIITTGGGGLVLTDDERWAARARYLTTQAKDDPIEYVHHEVGYNYRLTNVQAALGVAQLELLGEYVERKRAIAARYAHGLSAVPGLTTMREAPWARHSYWLSTILVDRRAFGHSSRELLAQLSGQGIESRPLWQPLHLSRAHRDSYAAACETAERLYADALSLPSSVNLAAADQQRVIDAVVRQQRLLSA
jgi:perosamine synthetase